MRFERARLRKSAETQLSPELDLREPLQKSPSEAAIRCLALLQTATIRREQIRGLLRNLEMRS
jgi:hypothetical protein